MKVLAPTITVPLLGSLKGEHSTAKREGIIKSTVLQIYNNYTQFIECIKIGASLR